MKQLPVIAAFRHAVRSTLNNLPFALRMSWPWMALLLALDIAKAVTLTPLLSNLDPEKPDPQLVAKMLPWLIAGFVAWLIALSSVAVNWHRYVLRDEVPAGQQLLRLDRVVFRYAGNVILIAAAVGVASLLPAFVLSFITLALGMPIDQAGFLSAAFLFFLLLPLIFQLSIKLPAIALGRNDFGLRDAMSASAGNYWQILGFVLLSLVLALVAGLISQLISMPFIATNSTFGMGAALIIQFAVNWVMSLLSITMLTSLYGFFVEDRSF